MISKSTPLTSRVANLFKPVRFQQASVTRVDIEFNNSNAFFVPCSSPGDALPVSARKCMRYLRYCIFSSANKSFAKDVHFAFPKGKEDIFKVKYLRGTYLLLVILKVFYSNEYTNNCDSFKFSSREHFLIIFSLKSEKTEKIHYLVIFGRIGLQKNHQLVDHACNRLFCIQLYSCQYFGQNLVARFGTITAKKHNAHPWRSFCLRCSKCSIGDTVSQISHTLSVR